MQRRLVNKFLELQDRRSRCDGLRHEPARLGPAERPNQNFVYHSGSGSIKLATYVGGSGTCGSGGAAGWQCVTVDSVAAPGTALELYTSLAVVDGRPYVAYSDHNGGGNSVIKLARPVGGASGNCSGGNWQCDVIVSGLGVNDLEMPVMKANTSGRLFVAYHNKTTRSLELASQKYAVAPTLSKSYQPATIPYSATTTLRYTVTNTSGGQIDAVFTDDLLPGQQIIGSPDVSGDCQLRHVTVITSGVQRVALSTSTLDTDESCMISLPVRGTQTGIFADATSQIFSGDAVNGAAASASLTVQLPPPSPTATPTAGPQATAQPTETTPAGAGLPLYLPLLSRT